MDLFFAIFFAHVVFVEAAEIAVISFVEGLIADDGNVGFTAGFEDDGEGFLGSSESGRVGNVNLEGEEELSGSLGFFDSLCGEGDIDPSGESVFEVPE